MGVSLTGRRKRFFCARGSGTVMCPMSAAVTCPVSVAVNLVPRAAWILGAGRGPAGRILGVGAAHGDVTRPVGPPFGP